MTTFWPTQLDIKPSTFLQGMTISLMCKYPSLCAKIERVDSVNLLCVGSCLTKKRETIFMIEESLEGWPCTVHFGDSSLEPIVVSDLTELEALLGSYTQSAFVRERLLWLNQGARTVN